MQSRTDDAADRVKREGNYWSAQQYGTKVHKNLADQINGLGDPGFRAEISLIKTASEAGPARYGLPFSIRIDVLEDVRNGTVCVYDLKTGKSGLSAARSAEIAGTVFSVYPNARRILVIETRPGR